MPSGFFTGKALSVIDAKGRLSLPSSYRAAAASRASANGFDDASTVLLAQHARHPCLQGYDPSHQQVLFDRLKREHEGSDSFIDDLDDDLSENFGIIETVAYDAAGRMVVPQEQRKVAGLDEAGSLVLFWGAAETFQIWNYDRFRETFADQPRKIAALDGLKDPRR